MTPFLKILPIAAALIAGPALADPPTDHAAHHPPAKGAGKSAAAGAQQGCPMMGAGGTGMGQGHMGQGQMGQGHMGQGGMGQMGQGQMGQGQMGHGHMGADHMGQGHGCPMAGDAAKPSTPDDQGAHR